MLCTEKVLQLKLSGDFRSLSTFNWTAVMLRSLIQWRWWSHKSVCVTFSRVISAPANLMWRQWESNEYCSTTHRHTSLLLSANPPYDLLLWILLKVSVSSGMLCVMCFLLSLCTEWTVCGELRDVFIESKAFPRMFYVFIKSEAKFLEGENKETESTSNMTNRERGGNAKWDVVQAKRSLSTTGLHQWHQLAACSGCWGLDYSPFSPKNKNFRLSL